MLKEIPASIPVQVQRFQMGIAYDILTELNNLIIEYNFSVAQAIKLCVVEIC